jgi:sulfoxide reductase heme-binding subunit YedZ
MILLNQTLALLATARAATTATGDTTLWFVTRAAAVSAYILLTCTAALGLLRATFRASGSRATGAIRLLDDLHPYVALLAAAFTALHLVSLLFDPVVTFSLTNLLLPLDEPYAPFATALGVFSLYTLAIVWISSWLRRSLPYAFWRRLHFFSFVAFALVTLHGILAGTDSSEPWMRLVYLGSAGLICLLVFARLLGGSQTAAPAA